MIVKSGSLTAAAAPVTTAEQTGGYDPISLLNLEGCEAPDEELWAYVRRFPQPRWFVTFVANHLSLTKWRAARIQPGDLEPVPLGTIDEDGNISYSPEEQTVVDRMAEFRTKEGDFGSFMRQAAPQAIVTGRWWTIGHPLMEQVLNDFGEPTGETVATDQIHYWKVYSDSQLTVDHEIHDGKNHTVYKIEQSADKRGNKSRKLPLETRGFRTWNPDYEFDDHVQSSFRAAVNTLRRICLLEMALDAVAKSRAQTRGLFIIPTEWDMPAPYGWDDNIQGKWDFSNWLYQAMQSPIKNPGDSDAATPIVANAPADYADKGHFYDFWTDAADKIQEWLTEAYQQLSVAWDVPSELLSPDGVADLNHWNVWALNESTRKTTWEPLANLILGGVTCGYLQPALRDQDNLTNWHEYVLIPDLSGLIDRPNRIDDACKAYELGSLSLAEFHVEAGFDPAQMPDDEEKKTRFIKDLVRSNAAYAPLLDCLELDLDCDVSGIGQAATPAPPPTSDLERSGNNPPDIANITASAAPDPITAAKIVAAADSALYRHYTAAGAHLKNKLTEKAEKQRAQQQRLEHIAQALGPARVAELGVEFPASAYEHFHRQVTAWADAATADRCVAVVQQFVLATLHDPQIGVDVLPAEQVIEAMV